MTKKRKRKINTELTVAISALIISLFTVFIYIYQARIMAKQHQDSVWPYIYSGNSLNEEEGYTIKITNKGIGPAIIKSSYIKIDGIRHDSWNSLLSSIKLDSINYYCSNISGTILSPGEEVPIFGIQNYSEGKLVWNKLSNLEVVIDYCSIHDECWRVDASDALKIKVHENSQGLCQ